MQGSSGYASPLHLHADREQRMLYEEGETVVAEGALPLLPPCCLLDLTYRM
jgi:hypothetical protein